MILLVILLTITFIGCEIYFLKEVYFSQPKQLREFTDMCFGFAAGLMCAVAVSSIACVIFFFIEIALGHSGTHTEHRSSSTRIVSIDDGTNLSGSGSGSFFLLFGGVNGTLDSNATFSYYSKDDTGAYRLNSVLAKDAIIYQDATQESAKLIVNEDWEIPDSCEKTWYDICLNLVSSVRTGYSYEIHIPPGSIKQDFTLNGAN